ncbi:MAG: hypothetical protein IKP66_06135 [Lachnospiraceae bacterium]|nr:hypothetical protein [Lachnospiraceae bacterium]
MYGDMKISDWLKYFFLMMIPLFNVVYLIMLVCGYNEQKHPSLNSMARALLIFYGILIVIGVVSGVMLGFSSYWLTKGF